MLGVATVVAVAYYGFLKNFSPDYQYFSDYLTGPKNFTQVEVTQDIYPMVTYSNIVLTMVALLVTDLLQYKPVIVFGNMALICAKTMLYFGNTVAHMQLAEMFYATSKASNLGYNTYIYTQIDKKNYQSVTAIVNISPKIGIMLSSLTGQILLFFQLASLENLLQINIVALILSLVLAFSLPSPNYTSDKDVEKSKSGPQTNQENSDSTCEKYKERIILLWKEFKSTYTNPYLLKWCIWMVISYGAIELVIHYYAQALWSEVSGSKQNVYNGLVDGIYMALSMTGVYIAGKVRVDWKNNVDIVLGLISVLKGAFILASSCSTSLFWCYVHYTIYAVTSDASLILYRAEMAQHLENFGLIFGINLFVAINIQSMLTFVLTSKKGLALAIRDQFSVIGWSFTVLGIVFLMKATYERLTSYGVTTTKQDTDKVESVNTHL